MADFDPKDYKLGYGGVHWSENDDFCGDWEVYEKASAATSQYMQWLGRVSKRTLGPAGRAPWPDPASWLHDRCRRGCGFGDCGCSNGFHLGFLGGATCPPVSFLSFGSMVVSINEEKPQANPQTNNLVLYHLWISRADKAWHHQHRRHRTATASSCGWRGDGYYATHAGIRSSAEPTWFEPHGPRGWLQWLGFVPTQEM